MSEAIGRLNRTIEAQGPDSLWVQSRDALLAAYGTIATLHERIAVLEGEVGPVPVSGDQHEEARMALELGVAAVEKIIRDRDVESHIAQLRLERLLGLLAKVRNVQEFCTDALAESEAFAAEGESGWDVEVDARTILGLLDAGSENQ